MTSSYSRHTDLIKLPVVPPEPSSLRPRRPSSQQRVHWLQAAAVPGAKKMRNSPNGGKALKLRSLRLFYETHRILSWCWSYRILKALNVWKSWVTKRSKQVKVAQLHRLLSGWSRIWIKKSPGHMWSCRGWWRSSRPRACRVTWCPQSWWTQTSIKKWILQKITTEKSWIKIVQFQTVGSFSESYLKNGGVEKVVAIVVWDERINHRWEKVALQIQSEDKTGATYYGKKLFQLVKMTHIETRPWWCICCRTRPSGRWSSS